MKLSLLRSFVDADTQKPNLATEGDPWGGLGAGKLFAVRR